MEQAQAFNSVHSDSGLFGLYGICNGEGAEDMANVLAQQLKGTTGPISQVELNRSKNQLTSNLLFQLETRSLQLEDIGKSLIVMGKVEPRTEIIEKIKKVTAEDIQRVGAKMLKSPVTVAAYGDIAKLPRYDLIAKMFQ